MQSVADLRQMASSSVCFTGTIQFAWFTFCLSRLKLAAVNPSSGSSSFEAEIISCCVIIRCSCWLWMLGVGLGGKSCFTAKLLSTPILFSRLLARASPAESLLLAADGKERKKEKFKAGRPDNNGLFKPNYLKSEDCLNCHMFEQSWAPIFMLNWYGSFWETLL